MSGPNMTTEVNNTSEAIDRTGTNTINSKSGLLSKVLSRRKSKVHGGDDNISKDASTLSKGSGSGSGSKV